MFLKEKIAIWSIISTDKLPQELLNEIENYDNEVYASIVSVWEIALKSAKSIEKIPIDDKRFLEYVTKMDFNILPIKTRHIMNLKKLTVKDENVNHKDPFDRMLLSQIEVEDMVFYTKDKMLMNYKIKNINMI